MIYMHWVSTGQTVNKEYNVDVLREFTKRFRQKRPGLFKSKMSIKTVSQPPYTPDLVPCDFWLFPKFKEKLRGCRYETTEEMKETVRKVIDTLTQEDFHGAFQKLLEWLNKCIAAGGDYFEGD